MLDRFCCKGELAMYETIYLALHAIVAPAWILLAVAPGWRWTQRLVHAALIPLVLCAIYLAFLTAAIGFGQADPDAGMSTLAGVMALFSHPVGALTGCATAAYIARSDCRVDWLAQVAGGVLGGVLGGRLPDIIEPARNPRHRAFAHYRTGYRGLFRGQHQCGGERNDRCDRGYRHGVIASQYFGL